MASAEEVHVEHQGTARVVFPSQVEICAYRGLNEHPLVYVYVEVPTRGIETSVRFTADEARQLAAYLVEVADLVDGGDL